MTDKIGSLAADENPEGVPELSNLAATHLARFAELAPMRGLNDPSLPEELRDFIVAREVRQPVTTPSLTPGFGIGAIRDQDFSIAFAVCPPNQGPALHMHRRTVETFICIKGRFKLTWGPNGEHSAFLDALDTFVVPNGVDRGFCNVSDEKGIIMVLITGGIHDRADLSFPESTKQGVRKFGQQYVDRIRELGLDFG
jgi:mannose-6-phosphate isomerase-like protein (cupin superfamily)